MRGLAPNTLRSYKTGQQHFLRFVAAQRLNAAQALPASGPTLLAFATTLFRMPGKLSHSTIKHYLVHVKHLHRVLGLSMDGFDDPRLELAVRRIKILRKGAKRAPRVPVTVELLAAFEEHMSFKDPLHVSIWAALCVGVYGLFRSGELTVKERAAAADREECAEDDGYDGTLRRSDVTWADDGKSVTIRLVASKTDPFRTGTDVVLLKNDSSTCPYRALRRAWEKAKDQSPWAPLFQHADGSALTYTILNSAIKKLAVACGLSQKSISGHSLRIGGATSLIRAGVPAHVVKELGRWKSVTYQQYIRLSSQMRATVARLLGEASTRLTSGAGFFGGIDPTLAFTLSVDGFAQRLVS